MHFLSENADIAVKEWQPFESGIFKVLKVQLSKMTRDEMREASSLKIDRNDVVPFEGDSPLSFMQRSEQHREAKYLDLRFVRPTSNMCERLLSASGYTLRTRSSQMASCNFEKKMFRCTISDVNVLVSKTL